MAGASAKTKTPDQAQWCGSTEVLEQKTLSMFHAQNRRHPTEPQTLLLGITAEQLESFVRFHARFHFRRNFIYASLPDPVLARFWADVSIQRARPDRRVIYYPAQAATTATTRQMRFNRRSLLFAMTQLLRAPGAKEKRYNLADARQLSSCDCITDSASHVSVSVLRAARDCRDPAASHWRRDPAAESFVLHYRAEEGQCVWDEAEFRLARPDDLSNGAEQATTPQANALTKNCKNKSHRKKMKRINAEKYEEKMQEDARIYAEKYEEKMKEDARRCDSEFVLPGGISLQSARWKDHLQQKTETRDAWKRMLLRGMHAVDSYVRSWRSHRSDYDAESIFYEIISDASDVTIANVGLRFAAIQMILARDACLPLMSEAQHAEQSAAKRHVVIHFFAYHIAIGRLSDDAEKWLPCKCCNEFVCTRNKGH